MPDVTMPRLSDTMEEGTIARWLKQTGEVVQRGDILAQIETDKATMDLESYDAGTLQEILAPEGTTTPIGQVIARIESGASAPGASASETRTRPPSAASGGPATPGTAAVQEGVAPALEPAAGPVGEGASPSRSSEPTVRGGSAVATAPVARAAEPAPPPSANGTAAVGKVRASPLARRIAEEHGLDLRSLRGSGPEGRVIRSDVEAALAGSNAPPSATRAEPATSLEPPPGDESVPLTRMQKTIARRMAESTSTVPHFFLTLTADVTRLLELRTQLNAQLQTVGEAVKPSVNDFVVKASASALRQHPEMNVSFAGDQLVRHGGVHIGIAVALEGGLVVPVVRDVDRKTVREIARESLDLSGRARTGKLKPDEMSGGTFSVSNLGMFGIEQFNAVINPPEAGILAVGAAVKEPAVVGDQVAVRERMKLTLSVDHRAANGADGARFLAAIKHLLEQPLLLLL